MTRWLFVCERTWNRPQMDKKDFLYFPGKL